MKFKIQYQSPTHSKGQGYWQTTRTFKSRENAEAAAAKVRIAHPEWRVRVAHAYVD